jgi:hypothetical protein
MGKNCTPFGLPFDKADFQHWGSTVTSPIQNEKKARPI